jgi:hypothetical protein
MKVVRYEDHSPKGLLHHQEEGTPGEKSTDLKCENKRSGKEKKNPLKYRALT